MFRKLMVLLVSLAMVIGMVPMVAAADSLVFSDMPNDWSTPALEKAVANGLITGYDGKIMPKDNLTRSQMAAIVNRSFGATVKASLQGFTDVALDAWYYNDMAKAVQMKTFKGDVGKLNPNAPITREEAFAVIARAFKIESSDAIPTGFADLGNISSWATGEVYGLINAGYIEGSNGYINPKNNITRAEFAQVMDNLLKSYVKVAGEYTELPEGNVMVNVAGVTLKDLTVNGDLIIGEGVGEGDFTLDNVNVTGRMVVRGGGVNSIIIKGSSTVGQVIVARVDGAVRIVVEEGSTIEVIYINDGTDEVIIEGNIEDLVVQAPNAQVVVPEGSNIINLVINKEAEGSSVTVEGTVTNIVTEAPNTVVTGTGTVTNVEIKAGANNSTIGTPETTITVKAGVAGTIGTGGAAIAAGTTVENNSDVTKAPIVDEEPSTGGGGGGGGTPLRLVTAWLDDVEMVIDGNDIDVYFDLDEAPGEIKAVFNKVVKITKIEVLNGTINYEADMPDEIEQVFNIIGIDPPIYESKELTLLIDTVITQAHLTVFGNQVKVTVSAGGEPITLTINLIANQDK